MEGLKTFCRLCGDAINDKKFKAIDEGIKNNLSILLLKLNIDEQARHVICGSCFAKLLAALDFKSICLHTDKVIIPYVDVEEARPVDLKSVYMKEKGNKQGHVLDGQRICRLCLQPVPVDNEYISLQKVWVESIQTFIPEVDFNLTIDPVVCVNCYDSLLRNSRFIRNCMTVDENMNKDNSMKSVILAVDEYIKSEQVDIKSEQNDEKEEKFTAIEFVYVKSEGLEDHSITSSHPLIDKTDEGTFKKDNLNQTGNSLSKDVQGSSPKVQMYSCLDCDYKSKLNNLARHRLVHENSSEVQMYKCYDCKFQTKHKCSLDRHLLTHLDPSEVQMHKCDKCRFETRYKYNLTEHLASHGNPSDTRMYKCKKCKYETNYKSNLISHMLTHKNPSEVQMYKCDKCKYETKYKSAVIRHQLKHKDPSKVHTHKCDKCKFETECKRTLIEHLLSHGIPSGIQNYKCEKCKYETNYKSNLKKHMLTHEDAAQVRMYKCDKCKFESKYKSVVIRHQLNHKNPSEGQMHKCDNCGFETRHRGHLARHRLAHKDPLEAEMQKCDESKYET